MKSITNSMDAEHKVQKARIDGARIRVSGNTYVFYIPKALVDTEVIQGGKEYD